MTLLYEKIKTILEVLKSRITVERKPVDGIFVSPCGYKTSNMPSPDAVWTPYNGKSLDANADDHFWFKFSLNIPEAEQGFEYRLAAITGHEGQWDAKNPQGILYIDGDTAYQAFDVNHTEAIIPAGHHDVLIYHYVGLEPTDGTSKLRLTLNKVDLLAETVWYDMITPFEALGCLTKDTYDYNEILNSLEKAAFLLDFRRFGSDEYRRSLAEAHEYMKNEFYGKVCGGSKYTISSIGHTHIDVAWLWTLAQTREKAQRSFSTVIRLMEKYPEYKFMSSQPQLYEYVKETDPELYEKIKERIREGRWEVEGAMWLEADTNLVSGESLVRQILFGKRFMRDEFGKDNRVLWLPDVFGYSGALPQILKKCGVDYFFTSKLNWNETNKPEEDNLTWQGIDGSRVFALLQKCYSTRMDAPTLKAFWDDHKSKKYTDMQMYTFGFGDGGGGPTADMLEKYERLKHGLPGIPKAEMRFAADAFKEIEKRWKKSVDELRFEPKRCGELYFEMHRGTYTSIAKNKKNNRKSELLYQTLETAALTDTLLLENSDKYPAELIDKHWHTILKNQFHDIIPGSSIKAVYDDCDVEYAEVLGDGTAELEKRISKLAANTAEKGFFVYNPSPFAADGIISADGESIAVKNVPPHGWKVVSESEKYSPVAVSDKAVENEFVKVTFSEKYEIVSVYDKKNDREVIENGCVGNELQVFEDYPASYDAWELSEYYKQKMWTADNVSGVKIISDGTVGGFEVTRKYGNSVIVQKILLTALSPRIDFVTEVDWHEDHVMLKAAFPTSVYTDRVNCDIQFGHISRPTQRSNRFDEAMFEVCCHKWADISESGYGVSLLNDCKYGMNVEENVIKLSLLKAPTYPNPEADREHHSFTYSLFPHAGDLAAGGTVREGYMLNMPLEVKTANGGGELPGEYALVKSSNPAFVPETIKLSEDGDGIIIRGYESFGGKAKTELSLGFDVKKAYLCDLLENIEREIEVKDGRISLELSNFEIVTIRVTR